VRSLNPLITNTYGTLAFDKGQGYLYNIPWKKIIICWIILAIALKKFAGNCTTYG
jgi:hypothetical protein